MIDPLLLVGAGGGLGALLRYGLQETIVHDWFPVSVLVVNVVGTFALGLLTFTVVRSEVLLVFGVGLCGAFTTFSSFAVETIRLWEQDRPVAAVVHAGGNFGGAVVALALAWGLASVV